MKNNSFGGGLLGNEHPMFGEPYTKEMEFLLKESKVEIVKFEDKTMKGGLGEDLIHIKLRIVGS